jgi:DNA-binding IclR family transcriptional regulator
MRKKASVKLPTSVDISKKTDEEVFNLIAEFMVHSQNRMSAKRSEIAQYFNISYQKASRILNMFTSQGRLKRDHEVDDLYWLELNVF